MMFTSTMKYRIRVILFLILLLAGCMVHYVKYDQFLPGNLHKIVELLRKS